MILSRIDSDLLRYLITHAAEPGTRLPPIEEISRQAGISVGKLREQLEVARVLGLVDARPGRGIQTLPYDFLPAVRLSLLVALALDQRTFRAFSTLRIHLETAFWDEAVALLTDEDKDRLQELVAAAWAKLNQERIQIPYPEHRDFHLTIFSRLENPFVQGLLRAYWEAYEAVDLSTYADYHYLQDVWDYHNRIVAAIRTGDYAAGKKLLSEHMLLIDRMGAAHEIPVSASQLRGGKL